MRTPLEILTDGDEDEMKEWVQHQLDGDWFTSDLVRLFFHADTANYAKLAQGFPWEGVLIRWYKDGVNPRNRRIEPLEGLSVNDVDEFMKALEDL